MPAPNVDLVLVIDSSASMRPCFDGLRAHLGDLLSPMQGQVSKVRYGVVAQSVGEKGEMIIYQHVFLNGMKLQDLYRSSPNAPGGDARLFTEDATVVTALLASLQPHGNEDTLVALDIALDFPFGPLQTTKRVVALFSDEPFETGMVRSRSAEKLSELFDKIQARRVQLFCAIPDGPIAQQLATVDRCEIEIVENGQGLAAVDFRRLLGQMGKSISASMLQATGELPWRRALYSQDLWLMHDGASYSE